MYHGCVKFSLTHYLHNLDVCEIQTYSCGCLIILLSSVKPLRWGFKITTPLLLSLMYLLKGHRASVIPNPMLSFTSWSK